MFQQPAIDCHCHVIDPVRFPFGADTRYRPSGLEIAPIEHLMRMMDLHNVHYALIVGTNSGYAEDLSPVVDAIARGEGRFKGIAVVANDIAANRLARLKALGFVGVAFNVPFHGEDYYTGAAELIRKLADLDMFLQIQAKEGQLLAFLPAIERSNVRLLIDHCGRPTPNRGLDQPGFKELLDLGRAGRASVKLSGFSQCADDSYPYQSIQPYIRALIDAFTPDGCLWGSDWPFLRAPERIDYAPLLQLMAEIVPDEAERRKLLWDTPRRLFGFGV